MQFKHPEILYALILLLIPIFIHLFQLRRFQKVPFTNVDFLKKITLQTRKSSEIKKWLTLLTRLLLLASVIFAFSQPYLSNNISFNAKKETVIYLDNSFSMQAKGSMGTLLQRSVQDLLENLDSEDVLTLITNNSTYKNTTINSIKNDLLQLGYSSSQLSYNAALLKGQNSFSKDETSLKNLIFISDFQDKNESLSSIESSKIQTNLVQLKPVNDHNLSIDSLFISNKTPSEIELTVIIKNQGDKQLDVPVSLFNEDKLIAKTSVDIENDAQVTFSVNSDKEITGKVLINDIQLQFDNTLFFNLNKPQKINVLAISDADDSFLKKIYSSEEFNYRNVPLTKLNFSDIDNQDLVIINELDLIPNPLVNVLKSVTLRKGIVLIIPSNNINIPSYNQLFKNYNINFNTIENNEKKIVKINFSHPLFKNVFNKQINNFQYPKVNSYYPVQSNSASALLNFEDGKPFLLGSNNFYTFSSSINISNSNFQNSPLIVPALYNIGKESLKLSKPYYTIGKENKIDIITSLKQDQVVILENNSASIIPQQQTFKNKVTIETLENPEIAGIYKVKSNGQEIERISFNYNRDESRLNYLTLNQNNEVVSNSIADVLTNIKSSTKVNELWKWFVIFALIMLIIEMLILKFYK